MEDVAVDGKMENHLSMVLDVNKVRVDHDKYLIHAKVW